MGLIQPDPQRNAWKYPKYIKKIWSSGRLKPITLMPAKKSDLVLAFPYKSSIREKNCLVLIKTLTWENLTESKFLEIFSVLYNSQNGVLPVWIQKFGVYEPRFLLLPAR